MSYPSLLTSASSEHPDEFALAIDHTFFARLIEDPESLLVGFAAIQPQWLTEHPRYLVAQATTRAVSQPYVPVPDDVFRTYAAWVANQEQPAARDLLCVGLVRLGVLLAVGRISDAVFIADECSRIIQSTGLDTDMNDILPGASIRLGLTKLLADDLPGAIGLFGDGARRARINGHPAAPYIDGFSALAFALDGDLTTARQHLRRPSRQPADRMTPLRKTFEETRALAEALVALESGTDLGSKEWSDSIQQAELWWVIEHVEAKQALIWGRPEPAAGKLRASLLSASSMVGPGTIAGAILYEDLANLYLSFDEINLAADALSTEVMRQPNARGLAARARLALANGRPDEALRLSIQAGTSSSRIGGTISLQLTRAASELALGSYEAGRARLHRAAENIRESGAYAEVAVSPASLREELDEILGDVSRSLPQVFSPVTPVLLTARENEVLDALHRFSSVKELASALHISPNTAKTHLRSLYKKLGVTTREQAIHMSRNRSV
ncbi:response regulator transcription factor [Agreia bicolorata]|uniref:response regulator transcription factor n=1 Tax=Agreia bicolorata TaxID=110935 RepID=UPI000A026FD4|nr:LuxR C-terminal-related transcriptional regulator [Agreia bicolorata]